MVRVYRAERGVGARGLEFIFGAGPCEICNMAAPFYLDNQGLLIVSLSGIVLYACPRFCELRGRNPEGLCVWEEAPMADRFTLRRESQILRSKPSGFVRWITTSSGEWHISAAVFPVDTHNGRVFAAVCYFNECTREKRRQGVC